MSYEYKSNPIRDAVIFAGVDIPDHRTERQIKNTLRGDAAIKKALDNLAESYKTHKANLNFSYGKYLKIVEKNIKEFNSSECSSDVRAAVANKLLGLAENRIKQKESQFGVVHTFFHKFLQMCKGHGFQTKGQWGLEVASGMIKYNTTAHIDKLKGFITNDMGNYEKIDAETIGKINELSEPEFKQVLDNLIFKEKEPDRFAAKKNKLVLYQGLSDEKKKIFADQLFSRKDWLEQMTDIIAGEEPKDFILANKETIVTLFKSNPKDIIQRGNVQGKAMWLPRNLNWVVQVTIKELLDKESYLELGEIVSISRLRNVYNGIDIKEALHESEILTAEDIKKLKENVQVWGLEK